MVRPGRTLARRALLAWTGALLLAAGMPAPAQPAGAASHAGHKGHAGHMGRHKPQLAIGAAFSPTGELWIVGLDEQARLFTRSSADAGRSWSAPRVLDTAGDTVAAEGESSPKIAFGPEGRAVITYTQPLDKPYTGRIRMLRSADGGRSFSAPFTVHRDQQVITHRFDAVAFDAKGTLHTLWIDKRDAEASRAAGRKDYRGAAIYRNASTDGGVSFGPDMKVADHSCECCRIALAPAPDGGVAALWRHVFAPNQRDHAFATIVGTAQRTQAVRATQDGWAIDACPHHGPGLAPAAQGYHAVWFGERAGVAGVRYGRLTAEGTPQGEPRLLPDAQAEHADVRSAGRHVAITWRGFDGEAFRWRAWVSDDDGRNFKLRELGRSGGDSDHPRLAQHGQRIVALWRTAEGVKVETLVP